jgi:hypothetical protein
MQPSLGRFYAPTDRVDSAPVIVGIGGVVSTTATADSKTMPNKAAHLCSVVRDSSSSPVTAIARNPMMKIIDLIVATC